MRRHILSRADVAAAMWCERQLLSALRAMLLSALPRSHTFRWLCAYDEIRLFEPKALQSSQRSSLFEDGPSSLGAVAFRDPKRVRARSAVAIRHFGVAWPPLRYLHLLFARPSHHPCSSRFLPSAPLGVVVRVVGLSRHPQAVQEDRQLPRHCHRRPLLGVLAPAGGYLFAVAP